jgi:hypothetical protein
MLCASCLGVQGSGDVISESREVTGFDEVELVGSGRVDIAVTGTESLTIEAEDNIMPLIESDVRNGSLILDYRSAVSPSVDVVFTITAAELSGIDLSGSGVVDATGVDGTDFFVEISGSGDVRAEGTLTGFLSISISGSGEFDGVSLTAPDGEVDVSGSGNAVVDVTETLDISISGSGDVEYIGSPDLDVDTSGSGNVTQRD